MNFYLVTIFTIITCELEVVKKVNNLLEENSQEFSSKILIESDFTCDETYGFKKYLKCLNNGRCARKERSINTTHYIENVHCNCLTVRYFFSKL